MNPISARSKRSVVLLFFLFWISGCGARQTPPAVVKPEHEILMFSAADLPISTGEEDIELILEILSEFSVKEAKKRVPSLLIPAVGKRLLDTPYVAHTLEMTDTEQLTVNMGGVDCTTFVEYVLALALSIEQGKTGFEEFAANLAFLRYREGFPDGYSSRLHYFSEWLSLHAKQGLLELVSQHLGSLAFDNRVWYMSAHPEAYRQLANPILLEQISQIEKKVSEYELKYIPKDSIKALENQIRDGDIIALTTNIEGLDVLHTGFAVHENGRLHLLHASSTNFRVEVTPVPLSEYMSRQQRVTGILVGRLVDHFPEH